MWANHYQGVILVNLTRTLLGKMNSSGTPAVSGKSSVRFNNPSFKRKRNMWVHHRPASNMWMLALMSDNNLDPPSSKVATYDRRDSLSRRWGKRSRESDVS